MSEFEQKLADAVRSLSEGGQVPMQNAIVHFIGALLVNLSPDSRPPEVVDAFRETQAKLFQQPMYQI